MSLARRAVLAAARTRPAAFVIQSRAASSHDHHDDHHDHHHQEDTTVYPRESFGSSFWRNVVLVTLLGGAAIKYAPSAGDDVYLTRWMALYATPREYWLGLNAKHAAQQEDVSDATLLLANAKLAPIHRLRYPQSLDQGSTFLNTVGE